MTRRESAAPQARDAAMRRSGPIFSILTAAAVIVVTLLAVGSVSVRAAEPAVDTSSSRVTARDTVHVMFQRGVVMLHAKDYERAFDAFHAVLELAPRLVEAHVNLGFSLIGLGRFGEAADFFYQATVLEPEQANAYYGLAVALEELGDIPGAIGAMRVYIHLSGSEDRYVSKARSALWEWEQQLAADRRTSEPVPAQSAE